MSQIIRLVITGDAARAALKRHADQVPLGHVATITEPKKKRAQEEKYHAMIAEISAQCEFMGRKWGKEEWKRLLIDAYVRVSRDNAKAEGRPDPFSEQGQVVPSLDGKGFVQLGVQSRNFRVKQAAEFIEYLYAFGAEQGVVFSERVQEMGCA